MYFVIQNNLVLFRLAHMFQIIFVGVSRTEQDSVLRICQSVNIFGLFCEKINLFGPFPDRYMFSFPILIKV